MPLATGTILIDRYRIVKVLAQGPSSTVYRAWNLAVNGPCAVREIAGLSAETRQQMNYAASMMESLSHPNLPRITGHFVLADSIYVVMDIIEGEDLNSLLARSGKMTWGQVKPLADQLCSAVSYLHHQVPPIILGNIQPNNIYVNREGRVFLTGLGSTLTAGSRAFAPGYAPPEQYAQAAPDARVDIYAIGANLYTLLTGQAPLEGSIRKIDDRLAGVRDANPSAPPNVEEAIRRALLVKASERFASVDEFQAALAGASNLEMHKGMEEFLREVNRPAPPRPAPAGPLPSPGRWPQPSDTAARTQTPPPDEPQVVTRSDLRPKPAYRPRTASWVAAVTMFLVVAICGAGALLTSRTMRQASAPAVGMAAAPSPTKGAQATSLAAAAQTPGSPLPPVAAMPGTQATGTGTPAITTEPPASAPGASQATPLRILIPVICGLLVAVFGAALGLFLSRNSRKR